MKLRGTTRRWVLAGAGSLLLLFALLFHPSESSSEDTLWFDVKRTDLTVDLFEVGEIQAVNAMFVKAPYEWRADLQIIDMVPEGIVVEKGDVLVQLDTGYLEAELGAAQSELQSHQAELKRLNAEQTARLQELQNQVENARYAGELAKLQEERLKYESEARRANARLELQKAEIALKEAQTKLASQRTLDSLETEKVLLNIAKEQARVREVLHKMDELTLRAPLSGLVVYHEYRTMDGRQKYKIGDKVQPGGAIIELPDLSAMQVEFRVHEVDRDKIDVGQRALLTLEAFPEKTFTAHIEEIARLAEPAENESEVKLFSVIAGIDESDAVLKPGMSAKVRVILEEHQDVLAIPCTAVFERDGQPVVLTRDSWPKAQPVTLGARHDYLVVVEEGLSPGDKIAWHPPEEEAHRYHPSGFAHHLRQQREKPQQLTEAIERMRSLGLDFDYAGFRKGELQQAPGDTTKRSHAPSRTIRLPDGRTITVTPGASGKMPGGIVVKSAKASQPEKSSTADSTADKSAEKITISSKKER